MIPTPAIRSTLRFITFFCFSWCAVCTLCGCGDRASGKSQAGGDKTKLAMPVTVAPAVEKTIPLQIQAIGNVQPYATVSVRAQVGGELMGVHFTEGGEVKKGDLLFTIDARPYTAKLKQAEAALARDKAQLQNARKQVERYAAVVKKGYVAEEQFEQISTNATAMEATVRADEAAVESAKLDVQFCTIRSPVNGCTGELKVNQGNLIKPGDNDNPLVVIRQVSPIHVIFSVPEQNLDAVRNYMKAGKLAVKAVVEGVEGNSTRDGSLDFIDNTVNTTTGGIQLKAVFPNKDHALWPGRFARVSLTLADRPGALVVPAHAVQTGQDGQYVYVLRENSTAEYRIIKVDRLVNDEAVVLNGLQAGEKVVTDGQLKLAPDCSVKVVETGKAAGKEAGR